MGKTNEGVIELEINSQEFCFESFALSGHKKTNQVTASFKNVLAQFLSCLFLLPAVEESLDRSTSSERLQSFSEGHQSSSAG